ncbi:hypothetical protein L6452_08329 [Arctium lappa]|uniref:Uncharacterized protein n=1 Tax=Arctium lappa TaxID=4217 RepID=A0ACB9DI00_ARCLA|nr:hypothetical protein L6452_08329 [Arctium lappa]
MWRCGAATTMASSSGVVATMASSCHGIGVCGSDDARYGVLKRCGCDNGSFLPWFSFNGCFFDRVGATRGLDELRSGAGLHKGEREEQKVDSDFNPPAPAKSLKSRRLSFHLNHGQTLFPSFLNSHPFYPFCFCLLASSTPFFHQSHFHNQIDPIHFPQSASNKNLNTSINAFLIIIIIIIFFFFFFPTCNFLTIITINLILTDPDSHLVSYMACDSFLFVNCCELWIWFVRLSG